MGFVLDSDSIYRVSAFLAFDWLEHGFGTRHAGAWPDPSRLTTLHQIHSDLIFNADNASAGRMGDGDALIASRPGALVGVRTADCVPVLVVEPVRRVVAAIHAGWRGSAASIAAKTVARMASEFGADPARMLAAVGPCIGECCYEVGEEVASEFAAWFPERGDMRMRTHIDLAEANRRQLIAAGVDAGQVFLGAPCTSCDPDLHSFRRDRDQGRLVSAIGIRA